MAESIIPTSISSNAKVNFTEISACRNRPLNRFTVQDCTFNLGIRTIEEASKFDKWETFRQTLEDKLPYNSQQTRRRYASSLRCWALENGNFSCLAIRVWKSYADEEVLKGLLRERYLAAYPILGRFITSCLAKSATGESVPSEVFKEFLILERATTNPHIAMKLRFNMRDLGFLRNINAQTTIINNTTLPGTPFFILLHHYFAQNPMTVSVQDIVAHPFWRYLGGRDETEVRALIELAAAKDLLARYAVVDRLEQLTTRFPLEELLRRQVRL